MFIKNIICLFFLSGIVCIVFHSLEKRHALKEDLQNINASVLKTEKQTQTEENDIQKEDLNEQMSEHEDMNTGIEPSKQEEKETKPEDKINQLSNQQPGCSDHKFPDNGGCLWYITFIVSQDRSEVKSFTCISTYRQWMEQVSHDQGFSNCSTNGIKTDL